MNIICPEETSSEIDAALQEMLENTFFLARRRIFLTNLCGCHVCLPLIPDAAMIRERLRLRATKAMYVQCGQMTCHAVLAPCW